MVPLLALLLFFDPGPVNTPLHDDSLLIYQLYREEILILDNSTDYGEWNKKARFTDSVAAPAFKRLKEINGVPYLPVKIKNKEGFGIAYYYPDPRNVKAVHLEIDHTQIAFSVIIWQTKFIVDEKNMTRIPYIERVYYGKDGAPKYIEKLSPVTWEKYR